MTIPQATLSTEAQMQAFDPETYSAFGSFHPPYIEVERYFFQYRAWHMQRVFHTLTIHANEIGCGFIGIYGIAKIAGLSETNVRRELLHMVELGWLRLHLVRSPSRRQRSIDWQLSPAVIYIAPDHIRDALAIWEAGISQFNEIINEQPENLVNQNPEPVKTTRIQNQNQNHHHHQNPDEESPQIAREGHDRVDPEIDPPAQREAPNPAANGRGSQRQQNRSSAPPPPDLALCRQPLGDPDAEVAAGDAQARLGTRIVQARQLILWFGTLKVHKAMEWLNHEMAGGFVPRSRFGLVRSWLEDDVILDDDDPAALERKDYIHGKYADFIQS